MKKALSLAIECRNLLIAFISVDLALYILLVLLRHLFGIDIPLDQYQGSAARYGMFGALVGAFAIIESFVLVPFIHAGLYGLVFLKMNSRGIGLTQFVHLARGNFGTFFYISILFGVVAVLSGIASYRMVELVLGYTSLNYQLFTYPLLFLGSLLSVLSYPIAIAGFFSGRKLMPIRSSLAKVVTNLSVMRPIAYVLLIKTALSSLYSIVATSDPVLKYVGVVMMGLNEAAGLLVLVYSYLLITENFYWDLDFDFDRVIRSQTTGNGLR